MLMDEYKKKKELKVLLNGRHVDLKVTALIYLNDFYKQNASL